MTTPFPYQRLRYWKRSSAFALSVVAASQTEPTNSALLLLHILNSRAAEAASLKVRRRLCDESWVDFLTKRTMAVLAFVRSTLLHRTSSPHRRPGSIPGQCYKAECFNSFQHSCMKPKLNERYSLSAAVISAVKQLSAFEMFAMSNAKNMSRHADSIGTCCLSVCSNYCIPSAAAW